MKLRKDKWENVILGEVCEIDPSKKEITDVSDETLIEFAEMADLNEGKPTFKYSQRKTIKELRKGGLSYFKNNDVLLAKMTPCFENGKSGLANNLLNEIGFGSTEFFVLRGKKIEPYLLYSIISSNIFIEKGKLMMLGTTGRKRLMKNFIVNYELPLPSIEEQKQIVSLFQSIETAIEQVEVQEKNLRILQNRLCNGLIKEVPEFGNLLNANNCSLTKFGIIVDCIEKHDKQKMEVSRFIGLENIVGDNFTIDSWGDIEKGTTFTKRFEKGDILFGKRRAYLRKVAVADFDGICSGDILIFRARQEKILPGLLKYYVASEAFIQHAVRTSAGSLSPRTKWKDLKEFTLSIPDLKTQKKIAELFNQLGRTLNQLIQQKKTLKNLKTTLLNEIFNNL